MFLTVVLAVCLKAKGVGFARCAHTVKRGMELPSQQSVQDGAGSAEHLDLTQS